ncbi:MAG: DUF3782 domain-containing protein [bacterium]
MEIKEIKRIIREELPRIMQTDEEIARFILRLTSQYYAGKPETEDRFDRMLKELQRDREEQTRKWDEQNKKWKEEKEEQNRKWDEQNKKWWENQKHIDKQYEEIKSLNRKHDQTIGALGARWGLYIEESFRNALAGILKDSFSVQVTHITEFDDKGEVFGRPDQVEVDLIIKNGLLIISEIKSSMSKSDMYTFERKARFYERSHECKANRLIVISPMVDDKAKNVASQLGIEVYSHAEDVKNI